jgi:hypothetical protein
MFRNSKRRMPRRQISTTGQYPKRSTDLLESPLDAQWTGSLQDHRPFGDHAIDLGLPSSFTSPASQPHM